MAALDSLQQLVVIQSATIDSLAQRSTIIQVQPAPVTVLHEPTSWLTSPLLQTLLGGFLAVAGGIGTEYVRSWRAEREELVELTKRIEAPLRDFVRILRLWQTERDQHGQLRKEFIASCLELLSFLKRTQPDWKKLDDNDLERDLMRGTSAAEEMLLFSQRHILNPGGGLTEFGKREAIARWGRIETEVGRLTFWLNDLANYINSRRALPWVKRWERWRFRRAHHPKVRK